MLLKPGSELRPASGSEGFASLGPILFATGLHLGSLPQADVSADGSRWWQATQAAGPRAFGLPRQLARAWMTLGEWVWKDVVLGARHERRESATVLVSPVLQ